MIGNDRNCIGSKKKRSDREISESADTQTQMIGIGSEAKIRDRDTSNSDTSFHIT